MSNAAIKYDAEKPPMELLPGDALQEIAKVLEFGARKYTEYGKCNCALSVQSNPATLEAAAGAATTNGLRSETQSTPSGNASNPLPGTNSTNNTSETTHASGIGYLPQSGTVSPLSMSTLSSHGAAKSVGARTGYVLTTAMFPGESEDASALPVTSASVGLKTPSGGPKHAPTCPANTIVRSGRHNWRKGFTWGRLSGAALRHLFAWIGGEDKDPESGLSHLAHAGCCVLFALTHELQGLGTDDRFKAPQPQRSEDPPARTETCTSDSSPTPVGVLESAHEGPLAILRAEQEDWGALPHCCR